MNEVDEIALLERILKIEENIGSCTMDVYNKLNDGYIRFSTLEESIDELREISNKNDEIIRAALVEINRQLADSKVWQDEHGKQEMEELLENRRILKNLLGTIEKIDKQTQENTSILTEKEVAEKVEKVKADAIEEYKKTTLWYKAKDKAFVVAVGVVTVGVLTIIWNVVQLGIKK